MEQSEAIKMDEKSNFPDVLYEDRHMLIVVKPAGVLAESEGKGGSLPELVSGYLNSKGEDSAVFTVHRLDRDVGGLTALAKNAAAAGKLSAQIAAGEAVKEYLAVLRGVPEQSEATLTDLLFRDAKKGKTYVVDRMRKGVREASLEYKLLQTVETESGALSLVRVRLHTGRTHQIRVQFASRGLPLVGDGRYGSGDGGERPALFAFHLWMKQPFKHKKAEAFALPPEVFPFTLFSETLLHLSGPADNE